MANDINIVTIVGRITRDPDLSYTGGGMAICKISIAVNRSKKQNDQWIEEASFFDVTLFGKRAESLQQYLTKGTQIACTGSLKQDRWEQDGQKRSKVQIIADNIQLLGSKKESTGYPQAHQQGGNQMEPAKQPERFDDDIPF